MGFRQRVGLAAALAAAEVDLLVVQRADFGTTVAARAAVVVGAAVAYFLLSYLAVSALNALWAWLRCGPPTLGYETGQDAPGKSIRSTASRPARSWAARTNRAPGGKLVPPPSA